jgi:NTE family protein
VAKRTFEIPEHLAMRARCLRLMAVLALAIAAPSPRAAEPPERAPCIGLVLGGGGARGAAHIGVIEVLEREHIPICRIAGTSMGAIVGGMYAAGYSPDEMREIVGKLDWNDLFSDDPARVEMPMRRKQADYRYLLNFEIGWKNGRIITPVGVVQGQKLLMLLRRLLASTWDVDDFDAFAIPFRAIATDIVAGKEVIFGRGDLPLAIRSSMSVPGAFAPTNVNGEMLVDGGIMNNVPIDVARGMGATRLIVVDVGTPLAEEAELSNPVALLNQMVGALTIDRVNRQLATLTPRDILIQPALGKLSAAEFNRARDAIDIGRAAGEAAVDQLRSFSASPEAWNAFEATHRQRAFDPVLIAFLDIDKSRTQTGEFVEQSLRPGVGKPLDPKKLEHDIGEVYGRGNYQQIDYHLADHNGERGLEIIPVDKPWGPVFGRLGFQLDDDFQGRSEYLVSAEITASNINRYGAEWRNSIWAGRIGGVYSEFYQPFGQGSAGYLMPYALLRNEDVPVFDTSADQQLAEYRIKRRNIGLEGGWTAASYWLLSLALERGHDNGSLRVGDPTAFPSGREDYTMLRTGISWDSLDDAQFPTRGSRVALDYAIFRPVLGGDETGNVARLVADWVPDLGSLTDRYHLLLGTRMASATDNSKFVESLSFLGGFLNLSGFAERSFFGNQSAFGRAVVYRRTGRLDALFSTPLYIGASLEAGNTWRDKSNVRLDSLIFGGSVFAGLKTPLGPVFLGYGYGERGHDAVYLTFGSLLRNEP